MFRNGSPFGFLVWTATRQRVNQDWVWMILNEPNISVCSADQWRLTARRRRHRSPCWGDDFSLHPDRPYGTFAKSNVHLHQGKSPEKKKKSLVLGHPLLISPAAAIVYKQLLLLPGPPFVAFKRSVPQSLLASVTTKAPSTELLPLSPQSTGTAYTIPTLPPAALRSAAPRRRRTTFFNVKSQPSECSAESRTTNVVWGEKISLNKLRVIWKDNN